MDIFGIICLSKVHRLTLTVKETGILEEHYNK